MAYVFDKEELAGIAKALGVIQDIAEGFVGGELRIDMDPLPVINNSDKIVGHFQWDNGFVGFAPAEGKFD
ncbi:hypothetical protein SEA_APHELION_68 [Gordonia phage Aphelion]|uniref:Uncharacterized protein n=2 Tax=Smoothievirus TaxID=1982557 RepID=A0A410TD38_9CAUD|nr:hypothetical protein BH768_gp138 [Gordonia phage ClubL]YP_009281224.1 hypothetical protein BIZ74_gp135 [Gordonia phage Cucurbita]AUE23638.1 hypothetical protein SEA_TONIANN_69 [Gordonia phage Toniann]QAU06933.1 hypothetical protein SEA_APHELION_68 [Gordonia phage Aphelion]QYC53553.1 hypothetical protein SEA_NORVS_69 [Gordonia phage Norvs]WKW85867.1 hypothetical protein SEA_PHINKBODEN_68 [Gordonia Phage PhinkBoden]ANA86567.1 hypothetical protein PBI_CLUBL_69 [Gordonia phage ClubL]